MSYAIQNNALAAEPSKKPYKLPHLVIHGQVKELTAAGSGLRAEKRPGKGGRKKRG